MDPAFLSEDEVDYELALRHVSNLSSLPRRARAVRLRALMQSDSDNNICYNDSSHIMGSEQNIANYQTRVNDLIAQWNTA